MTFATIYRSGLSRFLAVLIVGLVVSPYTAPFATLDGADFGGVAAVDVGGSSKLKTDTQSGLIAPVPCTVTPSPIGVDLSRPINEAPRPSRLARHAVLRL